jgi:cytochrome c5
VQSSLARLIPDPVLIARQQCEVCHGDGRVPTPEFAGWSATFDRIATDFAAAHDHAVVGKAASDAAARRAGDRPEPTHADCKGCEGRGYNEVEVGLERLTELLGIAAGDAEQ